MWCQGMRGTLVLLSTGSNRDIFEFIIKLNITLRLQILNLLTSPAGLHTLVWIWSVKFTNLQKGPLAKSFHMTATLNRCFVKHCLDSATPFLGWTHSFWFWGHSNGMCPFVCYWALSIPFLMLLSDEALDANFVHISEEMARWNVLILGTLRKWNTAWTEVSESISSEQQIGGIVHQSLGNDNFVKVLHSPLSVENFFNRKILFKA